MKPNCGIINNLVRPEFLNMQPYPAALTLAQLSAGLKIPRRQIVKLNTAENSGAEQFYPKTMKDGYYAYPDPFCLRLRSAIGKFTGFNPKWIACGNGSDEIIDLLIALFVGKDEEVLLSPPTFPMYEFCSKVRGVRLRKISRSRSLNVDGNKLAAAVGPKTKLVFIDSPGNPAGTLISKKNLVKLLQKKIIVAVDEAYFEYSQKTSAPLVKKFPNLVVFRSFSKWAGLAGLRLGYLIANPAVIEKFLLIKPPYNVNSAAQELGLIAIGKRKQLLKLISRQLLIKQQIIGNLRQFEQLRVLAGQGSYIMAIVKNGKRRELIEKLKVRGVLVKPINQPGLENAFLVSLESFPKMNKLIKALKIII